jgi:hypothetical protein
LVDVDNCPQEVCVWDSLQLDWSVVEPFICELNHGRRGDDGGRDDAKPVVNISFQEELGGVVCVP